MKKYTFSFSVYSDSEEHAIGQVRDDNASIDDLIEASRITVHELTEEDIANLALQGLNPDGSQRK
jgi:predicted restriction endonuclease